MLVISKEQIREDLVQGNAVGVMFTIDGCVSEVEDTKDSLGDCLDTLLNVFEAVSESNISIKDKMYWLSLVDDNIKDISCRLGRLKVA